MLTSKIIGTHGFSGTFALLVLVTHYLSGLIAAFYTNNYNWTSWLLRCWLLPEAVISHNSLSRRMDFFLVEAISIVYRLIMTSKYEDPLARPDRHPTLRHRYTLRSLNIYCGTSMFLYFLSNLEYHLVYFGRLSFWYKKQFGWLDGWVSRLLSLLPLGLLKPLRIVGRTFLF